MPDVNDPAQGIGSLHEQLDRIEHLLTETYMHGAGAGASGFRMFRPAGHGRWRGL